MPFLENLFIFKNNFNILVLFDKKIYKWVPQSCVHTCSEPPPGKRRSRIADHATHLPSVGGTRFFQPKTCACRSILFNRRLWIKKHIFED